MKYLILLMIPLAVKLTPYGKPLFEPQYYDEVNRVWVGSNENIENTFCEIRLYSRKAHVKCWDKRTFRIVEQGVIDTSTVPGYEKPIRWRK